MRHSPAWCRAEGRRPLLDDARHRIRMIVGVPIDDVPTYSGRVNVSELPSTRRLRVASAGGIGAAGGGIGCALYRLRVGSMRSLGYTVCPQRHVRVVDFGTINGGYSPNGGCGGSLGRQHGCESPQTDNCDENQFSHRLSPSR